MQGKKKKGGSAKGGSDDEAEEGQVSDDDDDGDFDDITQMFDMKERSQGECQIQIEGGKTY